MLNTLNDTGEIGFRSRSETVADRLREDILAGTLKPGERLIEQRLAARFGIGQPTLREALKELELQGFVRKFSNRGTFVTQLTKEDFRKILEVRMTLEVLAIERAASNLTDPAAHELEAMVDSMEKAASSFDLATFHKNDILFHQKIWSLSGNEYLSIALERVTFGLFAFLLSQQPRESESAFLASAKQHRQILAGLCSRNPAIAREAFIRNTLRFWSEQHQVTIGALPDLALAQRSF